MLKKMFALMLFSSLIITSCGQKDATQETNKKDESKNKVEIVEMEEAKESRIEKDENGKLIIEKLPQFEPMVDGEEYAVMKTNMGDISIRFFPEVAPNAVNNFKVHAQNGYFDGLIFHRVIENFMIQGGDPKGTGTGGTSIWKTPFNDEFDYDILNFGGSLAMANSGKNTNGSQFFINLNVEIPQAGLDNLRKAEYPEIIVEKFAEVGGNPHLNFKHTVFGQVFDGMDIVSKISKVKVGAGSKPVEDVIIESIEMKNYEKK